MSKITIDGADRLTWLHALISQHVSALPDGSTKESLILDVNGRVDSKGFMTCEQHQGNQRKRL